MGDDSRQISVYSINKEHSIFNDSISAIDVVINYIKSKNNYHYEDLTLKDKLFNDYTSRALLIKGNVQNSWSSYVNNVLTTPLDIHPIPLYSCVIVLSHNTSKNIYAITFGLHAYNSIKDLIVESFGIDIISRLQKPEYISCKTTKSQSITGQKQGEISIYRDFHTLEEMVDDFGKIFQELIVSLNKDILEKFGIEFKANPHKYQAERAKNCLAKDSFKIHSSIPISKIEKLLNGCEWAKTQPANPINAVKVLCSKQDKSLIEQLNNSLYSSLIKTYKEEAGYIKYDLCNKDFEKYLSAEKYILSGMRTKDTDGRHAPTRIKEIFDILRDKEGENITIEDIKNFVNKNKIRTFDDDGKIMTEDSVIKHIFSEQPNNGNKYFLLNGTWYYLDNNFIESLNERITKAWQKYGLSNNSFIKKWDACRTEEDFIIKHKDEVDTIIMHPKTVDHIELFDMMHWDANSVYIYFIKQGFGNEIRSLSSQVYMSANIIDREKATSSSYLGKVHKRLFDSQQTTLSESDFFNIFNKKIICVFAFYDNGTKGIRNLKDEACKFGSNIAKYSLLSLVREMNNLSSVALQLYQIPK
jgi:uncharacterized protein (TIGR04141 family)